MGLTSVAVRREATKRSSAMSRHGASTGEVARRIEGRTTRQRPTLRTSSCDTTQNARHKHRTAHLFPQATPICSSNNRVTISAPATNWEYIHVCRKSLEAILCAVDLFCSILTKLLELNTSTRASRAFRGQSSHWTHASARGAC